jgi:hypothetical protein
MAGDATGVRPAPVLEWRSVRLRPLSEAECYARCYGARDERVSLVTRTEVQPSPVAAHLRRLVEQRVAEAEDEAA